MTDRNVRTQQGTESSLHQIERTIRLSNAALANGLRIIGAAGSGKTQLGVWLLFSFFLQRRPFLVFDPTRSLIKGFLSRLQQHIKDHQHSEEEQARLYGRIVYCDLSGQSGYVVPFSLFQRYGTEPLSAVADRVMSWVSGNFASSHSAPVEGYSSIVKNFYPACIIAAGLQPAIQVTDIPDLLRHPSSGRWQQRFAQVLATYPDEAREAVAYFQNESSLLDRATKERRLNLSDVALQPFRYMAGMRAAFGATTPGLDYEQIIEQGKIVLIDASGLAGEYQQQVLNWILLYSLPPFLKARGSGQYKPIGLMIDEISTFYQDAPESMEVFANRFGEMVHVLRRQYGIHPLCVIHQTIAQLHEKIAGHLAALSNQIVGKPTDFESAVLLAEQVFPSQPFVKRWDPVYANVPGEGLQMIDVRPQEFTRQEVLHRQAQVLLRLKKLHFLTRLTQTEGGGQGPLRVLDITSTLGPWPKEAAISSLCKQLATASGVSVQQVLTEIGARSPGASTKSEKKSAARTDKDGYVLSEETNP